MPVKTAQGVTLSSLSVSHTTGRTIIITGRAILAAEESRKAHIADADAWAKVVVDLLGWRGEHDRPKRSGGRPL